MCRNVNSADTVLTTRFPSLAGLLLIVAGLYLAAEGFLNVFYWRRSDQPSIFQAGRMLRGVIGIGMIAAGIGF